MGAAMHSSVLALALSCGSVAACADQHGGHTADAAGSSEREEAAEQAALCAADEGRALGWDEPGEWGTTPAEAFAGMEGSCTAPYRWRLADQPEAHAVPPSADGQLRVSLALDRQSARAFSGHGEACRARIQVEAQVQLETADGLLHEAGKATTRRAVGTSRASYPALHIEPLDIAGSLQIAYSSPYPPALSLQIKQVVDGCEGWFLFAPGSTEPPGGFGVAFGAGGWSLSPAAD
jgi:hypothetical protein